MTAAARLPLGACVLALNPEGQVLVVGRREDPSQVCLPGGKVEPGEAPAEAARRELQEETGLDVRVEQLVFLHQGPCEAGADGKAYWVQFFGVLSVVGSLPGTDTEGLQPRFVPCRALLEQSPFCRFNRLALLAAAEDAGLAQEWMTLATVERRALEGFRCGVREALAQAPGGREAGRTRPGAL